MSSKVKKNKKYPKVSGRYSMANVPQLHTLPRQCREEINKLFTPNPNLKRQLNDLLLRKTIVNYCRDHPELREYPSYKPATRYKYSDIPRTIVDYFDSHVSTHNIKTNHPLSKSFRENAIAVKISSIAHRLKTNQMLDTVIPDNIKNQIIKMIQ